MKLTPEEIEKLSIKRTEFLNPPLTDLAITLMVEPDELFIVAYGGEGSPEVVQAVREWIA